MIALGTNPGRAHIRTFDILHYQSEHNLLPSPHTCRFIVASPRTLEHPLSYLHIGIQRARSIAKHSDIWVLCSQHSEEHIPASLASAVQTPALEGFQGTQGGDVDDLDCHFTGHCRDVSHEGGVEQDHRAGRRLAYLGMLKWDTTQHYRFLGTAIRK